MKPILLAVTLIAALVLPASLSAFFAGQDNFAASLSITSSDDYSSITDLRAFTAESHEPYHNEPTLGARKTAWWRWTAPSNGFCTVDTRRTLGDYHGIFDTLVAVYTGSSVDQLTRVVSNGDYNYSALHPDHGEASCAFYAQQGVTYHIAVDGNSSSSISAERYNVILRLRHVPLRRSVRGANWEISPDSVLQSGSIQFTTTGTGALTGRFRIGAHSYPLAGAFGTDGLFTASFLLPQTPGIAPEPPVTLVLSGALGGLAQITTGSLGRTSARPVERVLFTTKSRAPFAGRFTAGVLANSNIGGHGYMTLTVAGSGRGTGVLVLPDGAAATFSSYAHALQSPSNTYRFFAHSPRNSGKGLVNLGFIIEELGAYDPITGSGCFIRPARPSALFYPGGYNDNLALFGGTWTKPAPDNRALGFLNDSSGWGTFDVTASGGEI